MVGTTVTIQPPDLPTSQENKMPATGDEDMAEEVVQEEAVIKDSAGEADASTNYNTHYPPKDSREMLTLLAWS